MWRYQNSRKWLDFPLRF